MHTDAPFDTERRFVRVIERRDDGFVEFGFAIGEPELEVELLMNAAAFEEFCRVNAVTMLDPGTGHSGWGLHDARTGHTPDLPPDDPPPHTAADGPSEPTGGSTA